MEYFIADFGYILYIALSLILIITFFNIAIRLRKILASAKNIQNMIALDAQKRGDAKLRTCKECGALTAHWLFDTHQNCSVCLSSDRLKPPDKKGNAKPGVEIDPEKVKKAVADIAKIEGVTETILNDTCNHLTVRIKTQVITVPEMQEKLKPIQDLGVETATLLA